jgi:hypothetical protein
MKNLIPLIGESKRRKKMKRNSKTKYALGLLALTLATTSIVGGTFAKYVTADSIKDEARVAKWGVVISGSGNLFSDAYLESTDNTPTTWNPNYTNDDGAITVSTADIAIDNLVAPGTKSNEDGLNFAISGTPEVTTEVTIDITAQDIYLAKGTYATLKPVSLNATEFANEIADKDNIVIYTKDNEEYVKVKKTDTFSSNTDYYKLIGKVDVDKDKYKPVKYIYNSGDATDATEIAKSLAKTLVAKKSIGEGDTEKPIEDNNEATAIVEYSITKTFNPNYDLSELIGDSGDNNITWSWDFESDSTDETVKANVDKKDTILGNLAALALDDLADDVEVVVVKNNTLVVLSVGENGIVSDDEDKEYGSVRTSFDITITATQVD